MGRGQGPRPDSRFVRAQPSAGSGDIPACVAPGGRFVWSAGAAVDTVLGRAPGGRVEADGRLVWSARPAGDTVREGDSGAHIHRSSRCYSVPGFGCCRRLAVCRALPPSSPGSPRLVLRDASVVCGGLRGATRGRGARSRWPTRFRRCTMVDSSSRERTRTLTGLTRRADPSAAPRGCVFMPTADFPTAGAIRQPCPVAP